MKQMHRLAAALVVAIIAATMVSCSDDNPNKNQAITKQTIGSLYCIAQDIRTGQTSVMPNLTFVIYYNYTKNTTDVEINSLKLPDDTTYPTIYINDVPFKADQSGWKESVAPSIVATASGYSGVAIDNFVMRLIDSTISADGQAVYMPGFSAEFVVENKYRIWTAPTVTYFNASTTSICTTDNSVFTTDNGMIAIVLNPTKAVAEISLKGVQFISAMPEGLQLNYPDVSIAFDKGVYRLSCESLIPTSGDRPYTQFPITNLVGTFDPNSGFELTYKCNAMGKEYTVTSTGSFKAASE